MAGLFRLNPATFRKLSPISKYRCISTSKKNSDTASVTPEVIKVDTTTANKNWISYGFDSFNKEDDRRTMHSAFFFTVTLCLVGLGFYMAYIPDYNLRDWAQREAFIELKKREAAGLPLIDPNYVDPSTVILPSDEELGDEDIII